MIFVQVMTSFKVNPNPDPHFDFFVNMGPVVVSSIPRRTMSFGWDFKPRSHVSVLYTGHVKEPEGSFEKRVGHRPASSVSASLSLGRPISPKLAESDVN